jgi:hypothetical protein
MEIDPMESVESNEERSRDHATARLGARVAITVALLAAFLGVCKVKNDKVVQAMERAETERLDHWNFYQARNIREDVANATAAQLRLSAAVAPASQAGAYRGAIAKYEAAAADQNKKKEDLRVQAGEDQKTYDALNYRDDQFDLSEAMIALAISLLAMTALTRKQWLYWVALIPTAAGVVIGLGGLMGWHIHSELFARLLF